MNGYVGLTDDDWYATLQADDAREANFWTPTARPFRALTRGEPLFFLLKKPRAAVCGFGIFLRYDKVPVWLAWEAFGRTNGVQSHNELLQRITKYRKRFGEVGNVEATSIGCIVLEECCWLPEKLWVPRPNDWHDNIVSGKGYDLTADEGLRLWKDCLQRCAVKAGAIPFVAGAEDAARYGIPTLVQPRLGQGAFRLEVSEAYGGACAVTTEHSLPVLEAAHIRSYASGGPHDVGNGIFLRTDLHRLFDRGYATFDDDLRFVVSSRLKTDYENGKLYYAMEGQSLRGPSNPAQAPRREHLEWHRANVFLG